PIRSPHLAHSPLSDSEYQQFFARLHPPWQANMFCLLRQAYGCLSPTIVHLDQDENHGEIPEGPVCTELAEMVQFQTFCQFAQYRCLKEQFYVKVRSGMWGRVGTSPVFALVPNKPLPDGAIPHCERLNSGRSLPCHGRYGCSELCWAPLLTCQCLQLLSTPQAFSLVSKRHPQLLHPPELPGFSLVLLMPCCRTTWDTF
uniref:Acrosin-binding protein n=1 Tax=Malurus cyaneus samueli TaxID=2593467 RepID=A0A8C5TW82_9PASS